MAKILAFRASHEETAKARRRKGATAEIVIFPGVRYERWPDASPPQTEAPPKASMREVLKLVE